MQPYMGLGNSLQTAQGGSGGGAVGGWVEVGRTTLGSTGNDITVSSLPDKRYYMLLVDKQASGSSTVNWRMGNSTIDTGSNYSNRYSWLGGGDGTNINSTKIWEGIGAGNNQFHIGYISNLATKEKLLQDWFVEQNTAGAGTTPRRYERVGKWSNTSNPITDIQAMQDAAGTYAIGAELVVLAWDPEDTHTSNFWEELYSGDLSGGAATYIDSGTIAAKKYLWYQLFTSQTISSDYVVTFNGDTGANYNRRYSYNNGGDVSSDANLTSYPHTANAANTPAFFNVFVINNSANEKLIMSEEIMQSTAGAGTAPNRLEGAGKWVNTSAQITSMRVTSPSGNLNTGTYLKIWGSD